MATVAECNHSVFDLVTKLATMLVAEELAPKQPTAALVAKRRSKIYESLLRSGTMPSQDKLELLHQVSSEVAENPKRKDRLLSFQNLLEKQGKAEPQETEDKDAENHSEVVIKRLKPGPLQLLETTEPLPKEQVHPKALLGIDQMNRALKPLQLQPYSDLLTSNLNGKPPPKKVGPRIIPSVVTRVGLAESMTRMRNDMDEPMQPPPQLPVLAKKVTAPQEERPFVAQPGPEKHFISDHMMTNELKLLRNKNLVLNYIDEATLIDHLKKAAGGLQSLTFPSPPADKLKLQIRPNTTLPTLLPEVLADFANHFLRAGCAFRRLSARTKCNRNTEKRLERPLSRAMRETIIDYLATTREFFLSLPADSLSQLLTDSLTAMQLLYQLDRMFENEPRLNLDTGITGSFLLSSIWLAIDTCGNSDFLQLLIYLLRCISQTYFVQLQRWIYHGELDESVNEIFISRCLNTSPSLTNECSKEFFDKSYQVDNEAIPEFLAGCEQEIFQCGKYNQVLRAYNAQHPVFEVQYPDIMVCLTEQQLKQMRRNLVDKYAIIYQRFGWCSMQSIFEERMATKRVFANLMVKRTQAHLDAWAEEQRELQLKANAQKKLLNDQLNAEQERLQQNRLEKRRQDIVNELAFQRECERMEDKRLELEKQELQKKVMQLAAELTVRRKQEVISPDQSTVSDLSFASCFEGPDCLAESTSDKDDANTEKLDEEAAEQLDKPLDDPLEQPGAEGQKDQADVDVNQPCGELPNVVQYQRSHSDVMNSNEHPTTQTEFNRNRQHGLSSDQFQECHATVHLQQSDLLKTTVSTSSGLHAELPPDINANLNCPDTEELTELQRNRLRNEHHDGFVSFNSTEDEHTHRMLCQLNSNTERARNRRRVMDSEFGVTLGYNNKDKGKKATPCLPLELDKLHVEVPLAVLTPMSTTSDVDIGEPSPREMPEIADTANNNNAGGSSEYLSPESPKPHLVIDNPPSSLSKAIKPGLVLPTYFRMEKEPKQDRHQNVSTLPEACNPFMARRCLQLSVMAPVNAHYALLRNEVLRIFQEQRIYEHFRKLRNYFFLLDGQFGALLTSDILGRIRAGIEPRSLCQKGILDTILTNALAACSADETTVSQNLTLNCTTIPDTLNFLSVEATSMLKLHCKIDWPLNLVISSETVSKYGQIFGYLLKLRHVSFVLEGTYEYLQQMGKLLGPELRTCAHFRHLQMIRHKLSHFMTSFQTHLVAKALQSTWKSFKEELCSADSIEALYKQHVAYLKRVAFLALLNRRSAKVKETIDNILVIILRFCKVIQSQSFILDQNNHFAHPRFKRLQQEEAEFEKFMQYLIYLGNKAATSGYQEEIGDLICIINFNNYYKVSENTTGS
ncbi:uncharacterized protein LOC122615947 [Drosophila teissieri]|uniref:uncharacterized protein LOC122615947 n=1 Tax=Drosophila teissieri TaxID=7243 RepID=UPI001CBA2F94|nr:uncharacterized protein LOC122615947 [Drosophila teissieri]